MMSYILTYIDSLFRISLEPVISGAFLLFLTKGPEGAKGQITKYIPFLSNDHGFTVTLRTLKVLFGLGVVSRVNSLLNTWARNHWRIQKSGQPWDFSGNNEIAVVTGGSSGFGLLIAKGLSKWCKVAVLDVQSPPKDLQDIRNIHFYRCDLTSSTAIHETAAAIRRDLGEPSILVNNAGLANTDTLLQQDEDALDRIFKVNIISHFILIKEFLPAMLEQRKGHIVSIASIGSYMSGPPLVDYCATKAGVLALHEGLKAELHHIYAPNGRCIQTTIVHPGVHRTGMLKSLQAKLKETGGQVMPPSNVANAVIQQVRSGRGNEIFMPRDSVVVSYLRALPYWMQEVFRDLGVGSN